MSDPVYELSALSASDVLRWDDLIRPYANRTLFHRRAWLDYLEASQRVEVRFWRITEAGRTLGYFCGGVVNKGPFKILGSPLRGWGTNSMGPVAEPWLSSAAFLTEVEKLARREHFSMIELESLAVHPIDLTARHYEPTTTWTFIVTILPGDKEGMWNRLDSTRRTGIRKAERGQLVVEMADDDALADEFYDQYLELMRRKGLRPPYPRSRPHLLLKHLRGTGLLIALRVRDRRGNVVATGFFLHDETTMYFWAGASTLEGYKTYANEYMHWTAMCRGAERGLRQYNMSGNGLFKKKFGGELVELRRWSRCSSVAARYGRRAYQFLFNHRLKLRGTPPRTLSPSRG